MQNILRAICLCILTSACVSAEENIRFYKSADGKEVFYYLTEDLALCRREVIESRMDCSFYRLKYDLCRSRYTGVPELASLSGNKIEEELMIDIKAIYWNSEKQILFGIGKEFDPKLLKVGTERFFSYNPKENKIHFTENLEAACSESGIKINDNLISSPELFMLKAERKKNGSEK
jgi:hypothetical protein